MTFYLPVKPIEAFELQKALIESQQKTSALNNRIEMLESQNALFKHEKHMLMRTFEDKVNEKDKMIMSLHTELEEKSKTLAQVVHKLHQTQRSMQKGSITLKQEIISPIPPKDPPPESFYRTGRITRRLRRASNPNNILTQSPELSSCPSSDSIDETLTRKQSVVTGSLPSVQFSNPSLPHRLSQSYDHSTTATLVHYSNNGTGLEQDSATVFQKQASFTTEEMLKTRYRQRGQRYNTNHTVLPPIKDETKLPPLPLEAKPPRSHRRFHLAKSQGLTSAPPCSIRLPNYKQVIEMDDEEQAPSMRNEGDGRLLIKHEVGKGNSTILNHIHQQGSK